MNAPKVFVSYSHEDEDHKTWVSEFASSLRKNGVDATLDNWDLKPGHDATLFMESQIRDSIFVILVCTPEYAKKSNVPRGGVGYEKNIISAEILQSQDLRPKFLPVLRRGDYDTGLPTYLGSKFAIDFRQTRNQNEALDELLRAIFDVSSPSKPPLGPNPFVGSPSSYIPPQSHALSEPPSIEIEADGHLEAWEKRSLGRFEFLRETRIDKLKGDPFARGYWQASFVLQGRLRKITLSEFLDVLRASETNRTGWDIGWVPTSEEITPYPFQDGIEVWLAENGGKGPGHSDFWRAEKIGTFSLFRGYQEDEEEYFKQFPSIQLDCSLALWRVAEVLLYIESFSKRLAIGVVGVNLQFRWTGLENRQIGNHKAVIPIWKRVCRQPSVESRYRLGDTSTIRKSLIADVHEITQPLFESFEFFSMGEDQIKQNLLGLFDAEKESK